MFPHLEPSAAAVGAPFTPSPRRFERLLRAALGGPLQVHWTTNRVRLASVARRPGGVVLRLHEAFAAGSEVEARQLVALLFRREPAAGGPLRLWFARAQAATAAGAALAGERADAPASTPPVVTRVAPAGDPVGRDASAPDLPKASPLPRVYSPAPRADAAPQGAQAHRPVGQGLLAELFAELNAAYFHGRCQASIRWGRATGPGRRRRRRSMQLGCYDFVRREIRMHPALGEPWVPRYVVALVVYHEMLHEVFGLDERGGRRCAHPPEFAVCEQGHPDYARARAWERAHLPRLLAWRA